ncbi:MAG: hypothetical protein E7295_13535 [Lachnospiraceae bacterium]|nr:hypothetical protein [Lachnospiraceae bacterium]
MNHKTEEWVEKKLKPLLKKDRLLILLLSGVLLLVIALPTNKKTEKQTTSEGSQLSLLEKGQGIAEEKGLQIEGEGRTILNDGGVVTDETEYLHALEKELEELLSSVEGAGRVRVMITLEQSRELVLEKEEKRSQKQTMEENTEGIGKEGRENIWEEKAIYEENEKEKLPFVVKQVFPRIQGVIVAAEGVGTGCVRSDLSEAVQALFGIEAHKVKVLKLGLSRPSQE